MQILDSLFLLTTLVFLARLFIGDAHSVLKKSRIALFGLTILLLGIVLNGLKWQLFPAYITFGLLSLGLLKKTDTKIIWRIIAGVPLATLLVISMYLSYQFPLTDLPAPEGQYAVGTLDYSITDSSRAERFEPSRNRELYVEAWYPVNPDDTEGFGRRSLWHELYSGEFDLVALLAHYLSRIETHSYIDAPIAPDSRFPVLVFNHGLYMFTSQNTQLMEHLASHGYVVLSVAHPFESLKVNLDGSGTVLLTLGQAPDIGVEPGLPSPGFENGLEALVGTPVSLRYESLHNVLDGFRNLTTESSRREYVANVIENRSLYNLPPDWQDEYLYNYLISEMSIPERIVETWVEDISFVLDELVQMESPVPGFKESIDTNNIGIIGMSFGGAAAGEFCKTDTRCRAGSNMDGFQFGKNWRSPLLSPFLYVYSNEFAGNSDWAYLQSADRIHIYSIDESNHIDLTELTYSLPILKAIGTSGNVSSTSAITMLKALHLAFFDQFLKEGPSMEGIEFAYPGLSKRQFHQ